MADMVVLGNQDTTEDEKKCCWLCYSRPILKSFWPLVLPLIAVSFLSHILGHILRWKQVDLSSLQLPTHCPRVVKLKVKITILL